MGAALFTLRSPRRAGHRSSSRSNQLYVAATRLLQPLPPDMPRLATLAAGTSSLTQHGARRRTAWQVSNLLAWLEAACCFVAATARRLDCGVAGTMEEALGTLNRIDCVCCAGEAEYEALDKIDRLEVFEEYIR